MSGKRRLRLLVDPPYPGESTSSFLARTAQAYRLRVAELLKQLVPDRREYRALADLDRWPPPPLLEALDAAVPAWPSGALIYQGIPRWCLLPRYRRAYCPRCFAEDLAVGRTPYFRFDWMAVVTFCCWRHHTPLFDWLDVDSVGGRRLPIGWIDGTAKAEDAPPSYLRHHELLVALEANPCAKASEDGPGLGEMFALLASLQALFERPAPESAVERLYPAGQVEAAWLDAATLCRIAFCLVEEGRNLISGGPGPVHDGPGDWLAGGGLGGRFAKSFKVYVRRQCASVEWRRYYWLFVARVLASRPGVASLFKAAQSWSPWLPYTQAIGDAYPAGFPDLARFDWLYQANALQRA